MQRAGMSAQKIAIRMGTLGAENGLTLSGLLAPATRSSSTSSASARLSGPMGMTGTIQPRLRLPSPATASSRHGWWQDCPELDLPGYDALEADGANINLAIGVEVADPVSGAPRIAAIRARSKGWPEATPPAPVRLWKSTGPNGVTPRNELAGEQQVSLSLPRECAAGYN